MNRDRWREVEELSTLPWSILPKHANNFSTRSAAPIRTCGSRSKSLFPRMNTPVAYCRSRCSGMSRRLWRDRWWAGSSGRIVSSLHWERVAWARGFIAKFG
jgi:hypothetical protein